MTPSTDEVLAELFATCSDLLRAGATIDECLQQFPQHAADLAPLLSTYVDLRSLRDVPAREPEIAARRRAEFVAAIGSPVHSPYAPSRRTISRQAEASWWSRVFGNLLGPSGSRVPRALPVGLVAALLVVLLFGAVGVGAVAASGRALPGDLLYPVKMTTESVRLMLARDASERSLLEQHFADLRVRELQDIVTLRRSVRDVGLEGQIESLAGNRWVISGLEVVIKPDTRVEGRPALGAPVEGRLRAPGDGSLEAIYLEVASLPASEAPQSEPAAPGATPMSLTPTATGTATATPTPQATSTPMSATGVAPGAPLPTRPIREPTDQPTARPTRTPTRTARPPTVTPTLTPSATPAWSRPEVKRYFEGWVVRIEDGRWTIGETVVHTTSRTEIFGTPDVGWYVGAYVLVEPDGTLVALSISALRPPEPGPEPMEFTDVLYAKEGEWWTIGPFRTRITRETRIEGDPQIGDLLHVSAESRAGGEIVARQIRVIGLEEYEFEGLIEAVGSGFFVLDGRTIHVDRATRIEGKLEVGRTAQVLAVGMPDGRLVARRVVVLEEPTPTPTRRVTTIPRPTATPTRKPTSLPRPTATPTPTASPTSSPTPVPSDTPAPPVPTETPTSVPIPSETPSQ